MKRQILLVVGTLIMIAVSFVDAPYPDELVLQHIPTLLGIVCLMLAIVFASPSRRSVACVIVFLWLHVIGARWIYSFVPYDELVEQVTGTTLSQYFGWQRNHYDRLVHFASGLLFVPPASEILQRYGGMRPVGAAITSICCVMTIGAVYEILEWQIAVTLSPLQAEAYNGQQGDVWDPQKDMALAGLGAILSAICVSRWSPGGH